MPISCNVNKLVNQLAFQIDSHLKTHLLKYVIQHEFILLKDNGYLIGETEEEKELNYIYDVSNTEDWIYYIFEKYPLIDNLFCAFTKNTITYIDTILNDYINEKVIIQKDLLKKDTLISDFELFLGDSHRKGKFVLKVTFENGQSLLYKPRSSHNDRILKDLITDLKSSGIEVLVKIPKSMEISGHSWCEYVYANDVTEAFDPIAYYNNMGKLLCVLYAIGASDIISDNIICVDGIPTVIDLECIVDRNIISPELSLFSNYYNHSVIDIGILPVWKYSSMNERDTLSSVLFKSTTYSHLPQRNGNIYEITFQTKYPFLRGFSECYNRLKELDISYYHKCFERCRQRLIIQDTSLYSFLQREMLLPEYLSGNQDIRTLINISIPVVFSKCEQELSASIFEQLRNYDIPSFYVAGNNIFDGYGRVVSSMRDFSTNRRTLSDNDMKVQCKIIDSSIEQVLFERNKHQLIKLIDYNNYRLTPDIDVVKENCRKASIKVAKELFEQKSEIGDEVNWISKGTSRLDGRYQADILDESLYSGMAGMSLLYAQMGVVENIRDYQQLSRIIFDNIIKRFYKLNIDCSAGNQKKRNLTNAISFYDFPLCCLFLANHSNEVLTLDACIADKIIQFIQNYCLQRVNDCGYLGGLAGYLDLLIELKRNDYNKVSDTFIFDAYKKLISQEKIINGLSSWPHVESVGSKISSLDLGGFSHGSSGIAYVLYKFYKLMGDDNAYTKFIRTLNQDRTYFDAVSETWLDGRCNDNNQDMSAWCHGAGGIGLSRALLMNEGFNDGIIQEEMQYAVKVIKKNLGYNQCVCHGDLGNLEILRIIGETLKDCAIAECANACANAIALRVINDEILVYGDGSFLPTIGLFLGKSGIAYQLLRFAYWKTVPSVLSLKLISKSDMLTNNCVI